MTQSHELTKPPDEVYGRKVLETHFRNQIPGADIQWIGSETPDYWLTMNGEEFAVEMTQLVESYSVPARKPITTVGFDESVERLKNYVRGLAIKLGILHGTYLLDFQPPFDSFKRCREKLVDLIIAFIKETQHHQQVRRTELSNTPIAIYGSKDNSRINEVVYTILPHAAWEVDIVKKLQVLANEALIRKIEKLKRVQAKKILVLLNRYLMAGRDHFPVALDAAEPTLLAQFHEVYVIPSTEEVVYRIWPRK